MDTFTNTELTKLIRLEYEKRIGIGEFQLPLFLANPIKIGETLTKKLDKQRILINAFYEIIFDLGREALTQKNEDIIRILFSETIAGMDIAYHKELPNFCWTSPVFYRTDQSISGKIYEIQAPGSGWGDLIIIANALQQLGQILPEKCLSFADHYAETIIKLTNETVKKKNVERKANTNERTKPIVYHMIDASSAPSSIKYLMAATLHKLSYWGLSDGITMDNVDYVTAHSAAALTTSNYFNSYMKMAIDKKIVFGITPNLIFDQKAIYVLPFHRMTKAKFSDEIRDLFPFTTIIENGGFYDKSGTFISLDDFAKRDKKDRLIYLKYGGPDLCRNWGSRAVFRLDGSDCSEKLKMANEGAKRGEIWLLQDDVSKDDLHGASEDIRNLAEKRGNKEALHIKLSAFNSVDCQLGIRVSARQHFKVHGQHDTYIGIGID